MTAEERDAQIAVLDCEIETLRDHIYGAQIERDALLAITPEDVSDEG